MTTFAVTGATGLLGSNLVWEIVKNNIGRLDEVTIFCLGRSSREHTLAQRIRHMVETDGWRYFSSEYDQQLLDQVCSIIQPIGIDLTSYKLGISEEDYKRLSEVRIDHFYHLAALSDLRRTPSTEANVTEVNLGGTSRILSLIDSFPKQVGHFAYVSSAYVCGNTYGTISPDFVALDEVLRNPYERTKLRAEFACRVFCRDREIPLKIFRPSIVAGRVIENPLGHVCKYDVFYSWAAFFLALKAKMLPNVGREQIYEIPVDIPLRLYGNPAGGLNIVSADLCAKVMYAAMTKEHHEVSYHLASTKHITNIDLLHSVLEAVNVIGLSVADRIPESQTTYEKLYYRTVGSIFTPYFAGDEMLFDTRSMIDVCRQANIPLIDIDKDKLKLMLQYAKEHDFGLELAGRQPAARYHGIGGGNRGSNNLVSV